MAGWRSRPTTSACSTAPGARPRSKDIYRTWAGAEVVSLATPANIAVGEVQWGLPPDRTVRPGDPLGGTGPVVLQVRDAHRRPEVAPLARSAAVVVEWGWPGPWDAATPRICTRGYSRPGAAVVLELLRKAGWNR